MLLKEIRTRQRNIIPNNASLSREKKIKIIIEIILYIIVKILKFFIIFVLSISKFILHRYIIIHFFRKIHYKYPITIIFEVFLRK